MLRYFELGGTVIDYKMVVIDYIGVNMKHPVVIDYCNRLPVGYVSCNRLCMAYNRLPRGFESPEALSVPCTRGCPWGSMLRVGVRGERKLSP